MKKWFLGLVGVASLVLFLGTGVFLYKKSEEKPIVYETTHAFTTDIIKKTVATGRIIPRKEVEIKSQVSGVVETVFVEAGDKINKGDLIAKIQLIPNMERLNEAESRLELAKISFENAEGDLVRQRKLYNQKLTSEHEYNKFLLQFKLKEEGMEAAENNVALIREGVSINAEKVSNLVWATVTGTVLDVPVKEGHFVTETNTFNAGTTIASMANMDDMIFEGKVDESEVGKIKEGMGLLLNIGAIEGQNYNAKLEYISPKGVEDQGTIKFEIRAAVVLDNKNYIRAGYSANADIVLDRRENVLAVNERDLIIDDSGTYIEVETKPQVFEKQVVTTGLSDGINIEILAGVDSEELFKKR